MQDNKALSAPRRIPAPPPIQSSSTLNCCYKAAIIPMLYLHPIQEMFKTLLIFGWGVSTWTDPEAKNPLTLLYLVPTAALFFALSFTLHQNEMMSARAILLEERYVVTQIRSVKNVLQSLWGGIQMGIMVYALLTHTSLASCLPYFFGAERLPLLSIPQKFLLLLFSSILLGLVRVYHLFLLGRESLDSATKYLSRSDHAFMGILSFLPIPYFLNIQSIGFYLSPALMSVIPFLAAYCITQKLIVAAVIAAASMAVERESPAFFSKEGKFRSFILYPLLQWLLDATTHTVAGIVGFLVDPLIAMSVISIIGHACVGWMMGGFWNTYLSPYFPIIQQEPYAFPFVMALTGLFAGVTAVISHFVTINNAEIDPSRSAGLLARYQLLFSSHIGFATACIRYQEHAESIGQWIKGVTKATGKTLGLYRDRRGMGFFCCEKTRPILLKESAVFAGEDTAYASLPRFLRSNHESQPRTCTDFFWKGLSELHTLCGRRRNPAMPQSR